MKTYSPNEIKNIALVGSAGSGKTTLAEAMMYEGGVFCSPVKCFEPVAFSYCW